MINSIKERIQFVSLNFLGGYVLFLAFIFLVYRLGNFYNTFLPKPFEVLVAVSVVMLVIEIFKNKKFKLLYSSIPNNILKAILLLMLSVFIGWAVGLFFLRIPLSLNPVLEFGTFSISIITLLLVLFYTKNNKFFFDRYIYALLVPVFYIVFLVFQKQALDIGFVIGENFDGLTMNVNIFSKTIIIPFVFFLCKALFGQDSKGLKILYIFISSALLALLFWSGSRGAILAVFMGILLLSVSILYFKFDLSSFFTKLGIMLIVVVLSISMSTNFLHEAFIHRVFDGKSSEVIRKIFDKENLLLNSGFSKKSDFDNADYENFNNTIETRLLIWPYYFKKIIRNPFGVGPNTHLSYDDYFVTNFGQSLNNGPHNTFLQIWLWGGVLGILSFLYIILSAFNILKNKLKQHFDMIGIFLFVSLFTLSIAIMFDDSLSFYWFFIILALSLRYGYTAKN